MKKALIIPFATLAALAVAGHASANPSQASATCQGGIVYEGHDYPAAGNTVTVKIDGSVVLTKTFGPSTNGTVQFPDKYVSHTWAVVWDRYNGTDGDRTQTGTVAACWVVAPTTSTTVPSSTTVVVTTTAPAQTTVPGSTTVVTEPPTTPPPPCDTSGTVASCFPPVPPTPTTVAGLGQDVAALTPAEPGLPRTGGGGSVLPIAAIICIGVGAAGLFATRRKAGA